jgi:hypothetical protein
MPNCDFYAVDKDLEDVLNFVFQELPVRVFESYSSFEHELTELKSVQDIADHYPLGQCKNNSESVLLQLWAVNSSKEVRIRKIKLDPKKCDGAQFRYTIEGWGLIQLYLGGVSKSGVIASHTNHNSEKRANAWSSTYSDRMGSPAAWNWKEVTAISNKLNRYIRKAAVTKQGSRPVLKAAADLLAAGTPFLITP